MNKLSVLCFSLTLIVFSAFSTASAQDLKNAWLEYENARSSLHESFATINDSQNQVSSAWTELDNIWVEINIQWDALDTRAAEIQGFFVGLANEFNVSVVSVDDSYRDTTRETSPRTFFQPTLGDYEKPWTPEPTWGSWEELSHAWVQLDNAWVIANSAWAELDRAWPELALAYAEAEEQWGLLSIAGFELNRANNDVDTGRRNLIFSASLQRMAEGQQ